LLIIARIMNNTHVVLMIFYIKSTKGLSHRHGEKT
jgi:hypothetical protein